MRRFVVMAAAAAILMLALAPGAAAKEPFPDPQVPLTGEFLNTFWDGATLEMPSDTPFYVENGWCGFSGEQVALLGPTTRVEILLDGEPLVMGTIVDMHFEELDPCLYGKFNYHNFRFGLPAGTYGFEAIFYWLGEEQYHATTWVTFI